MKRLMEFFLPQRHRGAEKYLRLFSHSISLSVLLFKFLFIDKTLRLCASAVIISLAVQAQTVEVTKSTRIEKIEGKEYYIHKIVKGQTLYSVSKAYNVLISEIVFENPAAIDGIKPDMELRIPVASATTVETTKEKPVNINGKYRVHTVEKGETLYAISKLYNTTVEAIKQANPDMPEALSLGLHLNIPVEQLLKPETVVYTQAIEQNLKDTAPHIDGSKINMVLLLPLYLAENDNSYRDTISGNQSRNIYAKSLNGLEFYEGALLAADSLSKKGVKAVIHTYDIPDSTALVKALRNPVLKSADVIIGPFHGKRFEAVADFAKDNNIVCVSPVLKKSEIADDNLYVNKVLPSDDVQIQQMGDYIGRWNCKKNIVVMHSGNNDSLQIQRLINGIKGRCDSAKLHVINTKGRGVKLVDSLIQPGAENIVVAFSREESYVSRLVLHLEKKNNKQRVVTLFGLNEWQDFENIEVEYFQNLNLHLPAELFVDFSRPEVKSFLLKFREKYLAEPGKYSYLGYDVTMYYLQMLTKFGKTFYQRPETIHATGLQSNFDFKKTGASGGLENQHTFILNYNDYRLVKVN